MHTKKIENLIKQLSDPDASKRRRSAEDLSEADERAIYPLIKALKDPNPGVQDAAMRSLISIGGEVAAYMVIPLLREDSYLRNTAMLILKGIGLPVIPLLYPLLQDKDRDVRKFAVDLICEAGHCEYPEEIAKLLEIDPDPNVRASAAKAIGILNYRGGLKQLISALRDEEWICFSAIEALGELKESDSSEHLIPLLSSSHYSLRYAAIEALGKIGSRASTDALMNHLKVSEGYEKRETIKWLIRNGVIPSTDGVSEELLRMLQEEEWEERLIAIKGLSSLKEEASISRILDIAGSLDPSDPDSEELLIVINDYMLDFGCSDSFINILNNPTFRYRGKVISINLLGEMKCREAVPCLLGLLDTEVRDIRRASIKALGQIGGEGIGDILIDTIDDPDSHVRKASITALGKICDKQAFEPIMTLLQVERYEDIIDEAIKALILINKDEFLNRISTLDEKIIKRFNLIKSEYL